ncbi:hypothetical protein NLU13_2115 [Sarocladium strictum]|uniref:Uncharacterized protein n=1 Tax=Sarocladium strictum TaxID=5046 RepID=A0AA39GS76_SARSR|nr:hypothetical protein NLU13_2115 [Sarocladium strictum]
MAGLVAYASSDDEDEEAVSQPEANVSSCVQNNTSDTAKQEETAEPQSAPIGPSLPPAGDLNLPEAEDSLLEDAFSDPERLPQSPYSANRSLIHDLTLPSVPDFDIPPSPPGSPPPAIDRKFTQFLDLKRKGIHFNQKLEQSAALKNPNLMDKLMRFVELDGASQYETTLPKDLWNPGAFPPWAYRESLRKSREQVVKEREAHNASGARKAVDFVPASKPSTRK